MRFDSLEDMPPALRQRVESQLARDRAAQSKRQLASGLAEASKSAEAALEKDADAFRQLSRDITANWQEKKPKRKYNNQPTERLLSNGECIKFGSKTEAAYYDELVLREKLGQVRKIRLQVEYLLKPAYTDGETGERIPRIAYFADFVFEELREEGNWTTRIVDTKGGGRKGTSTKTFAIKRKLMADKGYFIDTIERRR
nr:MAG TPA_asm: Endonuclease [Caudoviricetes sp.]